MTEGEGRRPDTDGLTQTGTQTVPSVAAAVWVAAAGSDATC